MNQVEKAVVWRARYAEGIELARSAFQNGQPHSSKCGILMLSYQSLGLCDLVIQRKAQPMIDAFRTGLEFWLINPGRTITLSALPYLETATLTRDPVLAALIASRIVDAPEAMQVDRNHHLAHLYIAALRGTGETDAHRARLRTGHPDVLAYAQMLGAVIDRDPAALLAAARAYLTWHRPQAEKGKFKEDPYGLVAMPVLASLALGRLQGVTVSLDDDYAPKEALE